MAHIEVHLLGDRQRERLGHRTQLEALAPFPPRPPQELWEFRRHQWAGRRLLADIALERLELELAPGLDPIDAGDGGGGTGGGGSGGSIRAPGCEERVSYAIRINATPTGPSFSIAPGGIIPAPCVIESVYVQPLIAYAGRFIQWNLALVDTDTAGEQGSAPADLLITGRQYFNNGPIVNDVRAFGVLLTQNPDNSSIVGPVIMPIGRLVTEQGKRIALVIFNNEVGLQQQALDCVVTLSRCEQPAAAARASVTSTPRAAAAPRAAAPPAPRAPAPGHAQTTAKPAFQTFAHTSSGAYPVDAGVNAAGMRIQRWALPDQPGRTFATLAEAELAQRASLIGALPAAQRPAATAAVRQEASQLLYGTGEIGSPPAFILNAEAQAGVERGTIGAAGRLYAPPYNPRAPFAFR